MDGKALFSCISYIFIYELPISLNSTYHYEIHCNICYIILYCLVTIIEIFDVTFNQNLNYNSNHFKKTNLTNAL